MTNYREANIQGHVVFVQAQFSLSVEGGDSWRKQRVTKYCEASTWGHVVTPCFQWMLQALIKLKNAERVTNYCEAGMWGHVVTSPFSLNAEDGDQAKEGREGDYCEVGTWRHVVTPVFSECCRHWSNWRKQKGWLTIVRQVCGHVVDFSIFTECWRWRSS